ncbi:MAG: hypothetical protein OEY20_04575 [Gemmatimonadota bacterium]|nr:hypothetical protein [Gemmatimonadota bacterium]MDH4350785.1 hypothetical protein [Gemmatimonadota bacterium]MDH5196504.1 hypothetical protein [Gemmatimonadota bacterium]
MIQILAGVGGMAVLFAVFGLMQRGRERTSCDHCSCHGGTCERTGEPRQLEVVE